MAVALSNAGTVATQETPQNWLNAGCTISGSNRLLLFVLQLYPSGSAPTNVAATCNAGSMVLIDSWTSNGVYHYVLAKLADDAGWVNSSWTNNCYALGQASSYTGVTQASEAAAVTTATHASGTSTSPSVTLASATGNLVVGQFSAAPTTITINDSTLFAETAWGNGNYESCGSYAAGATSVTLDLSLIDSVAWSAQAVDIVAVETTVQGSAILAAAGGLAASAWLAEYAAASFAAAGGLIASATVVVPPQPWAASAAFAATAALAATAFACSPASAHFAAAAQIAADVTLVEMERPLVRSVEERLHPEYAVMLTTNINAQLEMIVPSGKLVGRTSVGSGEAEPITIDDPLTYENMHLGMQPIARLFSELPAAPAAGTISQVTNSNTQTLGAPVAGGGSYRVLVWYNGTDWTVIGK